MIKIGIFADKPFACTGFARVCDALARELAKKHMVYFFGRFGHEELSAPLEDGFLHQPYPLNAPYLYVPCVGGVWDREVVVRIINHYKIDVVFTEDDWWSIFGIGKATNFWKKPFHCLSPIDSLPIHINGMTNFKQLCNTVYVPNSAYKILKLKGINSIYLPHGVNTDVFKPSEKKLDRFCFSWIGRDDERKGLGRAILAYQKIYEKLGDSVLLIHADWTTPQGQLTKKFISLSFKNFEKRFLFSQMQNNPHSSMNSLYNLAHINLCTAKAGGFEMGVTESAAAEVPSIVTNWTFMNENIIDGKTGWLVGWDNLYSEADHGRMWANINIDKLAERMLWCYQNPDLVKEAGIQARQFVTERFNWKDVGNTLREYIEKSVENAKT